ncbi:hypothetical protein ABT154_32695 [Streptomyces sp. NPDC001728]|uniref:hypothetical protein n=1 Tax=Streptomyces sp. NPDC001728 TaxID=3154396 RepID=UPI003321F32D
MGLILDHEVSGALDDAELDAEPPVYGGLKRSRGQEHVVPAGDDPAGDGPVGHGSRPRGTAGPGVPGDECHQVAGVCGDQRGKDLHDGGLGAGWLPFHGSCGGPCAEFVGQLFERVGGGAGGGRLCRRGGLDLVARGGHVVRAYGGAEDVGGGRHRVDGLDAAEVKCPWRYWFSLDSQRVFSRFTGTGLSYDNNGAPITLGPDGTAYVGVFNGIVAVRGSA